jgi:hypothetical protein
MQPECERATALAQPVRAKTTPPGKIVTHNDDSTIGCVWEQIGLLLERYQQQTGCDQ